MSMKGLFGQVSDGASKALTGVASGITGKLNDKNVVQTENNPMFVEGNTTEMCGGTVTCNGLGPKGFIDADDGLLVTNDVIAISDKSRGNLMHYEGELGSFDYNSRDFELTMHDVEDGTSVPTLHYIGDNKGLKNVYGQEGRGNVVKGSKIKIPEGITSCDYMFEDCKITSVPELPKSVVSTNNMLKGCQSLSESEIVKFVEKQNAKTNKDSLLNAATVAGASVGSLKGKLTDGFAIAQAEDADVHAFYTNPELTDPGMNTTDKGIQGIAPFEIVDENQQIIDDINKFMEDNNMTADEYEAMLDKQAADFAEYQETYLQSDEAKARLKEIYDDLGPKDNGILYENMVYKLYTDDKPESKRAQWVRTLTAYGQYNAEMGIDFEINMMDMTYNPETQRVEFADGGYWDYETGSKVAYDPDKDKIAKIDRIMDKIGLGDSGLPGFSPVEMPTKPREVEIPAVDAENDSTMGKFGPKIDPSNPHDIGGGVQTMDWIESYDGKRQGTVQKLSSREDAAASIVQEATQSTGLSLE